MGNSGRLRAGMLPTEAAVLPDTSDMTVHMCLGRHSNDHVNSAHSRSTSGKAQRKITQNEEIRIINVDTSQNVWGLLWGEEEQATD